MVPLVALAQVEVGGAGVGRVVETLPVATKPDLAAMQKQIETLTETVAELKSEGA